MTFLRGIFIGIICTCELVFISDFAVAASTREKECKGKQVTSVCSPEGSGHIKQTSGFLAPTCEYMASNGKIISSCFTKKCEKGYALNDYKAIKKGDTFIPAQKQEFPYMGSHCLNIADYCKNNSLWKKELWHTSVPTKLKITSIKKTNGEPETNPNGTYQIINTQISQQQNIERTNGKCVFVPCSPPGKKDVNAEKYYKTIKNECKIYSCKTGFHTNQERTKCEPDEQPNNNTITYDLQGGSWPEDPGLTTYDPTQDTDIGTKPEKENYIFMGWCIDSPTCASPVNAIPSGKSGQIKLYARWKQETIAQLSNAEKVNELENIEFPEQTICSPLDLYNLNAIEGILKENKCIPTKCKNGFGNANNEPENDACLPTNMDEPKEEKVEEECVISGAARRQNVTATQWLGKTCIPADCEPSYTLKDPNTENARCEKDPDTFVIKFEQNGGTGCENVTETYIKGTPMSVACQPTKDDFIFDGWYKDAEFKESASKAKEEQHKKWLQENGYSEGNLDYKTAIFITSDDSGDKTFYAKWTQEQATPAAEPTPAPRTECTEAEKAAHPNATAFKFENGKCVPIACEDGYKLQNGICEEDKISQLQDKYDAAKEKEQSLENRMLGGATMAATGIGGMELARGLAEQKADKAADADMTAYLSTFQCKVGDKRYSGGASQIEIPGGNELINLYQEYVNLANDLKERKAALGKKAGIESEVILDKANMGLYDETGKGIENGTYASLYRASKGNETDTQKIDDTKSSSKKRVIAGAVVGGAGAVGGMVGNSAINGKLGEAIQGLKDNSSFDLGSFDLDSETVSKLQNVFGNNLNGDIFSKLQGAFGDKLQNLDSGTLSKLTSAFGNKLQNVDGDTLNQLQSEYGSDLNNMSKADILKAARNIKAKN